MLEEFEKYMSKPNLVYFMVGVLLFIFGTYIALNPIMGRYFTPPFDVTISNMNSIPIVSLIFNSWFYWIMGAGYSGTSILYWSLNGWIK